MMPPLYHRVFFYLRQKANSETKLIRMPRGPGMYVSAGMCVTSLQAIADGTAYYERGKRVTPNKKVIVSVLKWLKENDKIRHASNGLGTVICIENTDTYIESRREKASAKKQAADIDPAAMKLAGLLAAEIQRNNPNHRELMREKREPTIARWAEDIDRLLKIDRQDYEAVGKIIIFCQEHHFWKKNILSGKSLREKWDRLMVEMQASAPVKREIPHPETAGDLLREMKKMEARYK